MSDRPCLDGAIVCQTITDTDRVALSTVRQRRKANSHGRCRWSYCILRWDSSDTGVEECLSTSTGCYRLHIVFISELIMSFIIKLYVISTKLNFMFIAIYLIYHCHRCGRSCWVNTIVM